MTVATKELYNEILDLPIDERLGLIDKLIQSITPTSDDIQQAWVAESEARYLAYKEGKVKAVSGDVVFERIRKRFNA